MMAYKVLDLFSGAGGLSRGFYDAGYDVVLGVDFDEAALKTFKANHGKAEAMKLDLFDHSNIDVIINFLKEKDIKLDVLVGGPPCQGFSMAGARIRKNFIEDERNYLFRYYYEIIRQVLPKCFVFENVKGITTMENGEILNEIISLFQNSQLLGGHKYYTYPYLFKALDFGIPQKRERFIILGVLDREIDWNMVYEQTKLDIKNKYPMFFHPTSVWDAISNLAKTPDVDEVKVEPETDYQKFLASETGITYNNNKPKHNQVALNRIKKISCGENWTSLKGEDIKSVHSGAYGRLDKDGVAPTVTTRFDTPSGGGFIHPVENRTLTPREGARIQSFSDDYKFIGNKTSIYKQIGNAVPPKMAYFIAEMIKKIIP